MAQIAQSKVSMDSGLIEKGASSAIGAVITLGITWAVSLFRRGHRAELQELHKEDLTEFRAQLTDQKGEISEIRVTMGRMDERIDAGKEALQEVKGDLKQMSTHIDDRFDKFEDRIIKHLRR